MIRSPEVTPGFAFQRLFDFACAGAGLLLLWPLLSALALLIAVLDGRPVLFHQVRVGRNGRPFRIWKFRTMRDGAAGGTITPAGDARVTAIGAVLRRYKLDELPQLFNVLFGQMSLVGPRPEVPEYVNSDSLVWRAVLQVRPGITDLASLVYRDEEALLRNCSDLDAFYRDQVQPAKLALNLRYLTTRSFRRDISLIFMTIRYSLFPRSFDPRRVCRKFANGDHYERHLHPLSCSVDR